jgi:hypothetical protein
MKLLPTPASNWAIPLPAHHLKRKVKSSSNLFHLLIPLNSGFNVLCHQLLHPLQEQNRHNCQNDERDNTTPSQSVGCSIGVLRCSGCGIQNGGINFWNAGEARSSGKCHEQMRHRRARKSSCGGCFGDSRRISRSYPAVNNGIEDCGPKRSSEGSGRESKSSCG